MWLRSVFSYYFCLLKGVNAHLGSIFRKGRLWQGRCQGTEVWSRHVRNFNSGIWGVLWIQFLVKSPNSSSLVTLLMPEETWVQFPVSVAPSSGHLAHMMYRGCLGLKKKKKKAEGQEVCCSPTILLAKKWSACWQALWLAIHEEMHCQAACMCIKQEGVKLKVEDS